MSLRRSPRITPALLTANRLNAQKSTGPRTVRGRETAALNSFQHGLRSHSFGELFLKTDKSREKFAQVVHGLLELLKPRTRPEAVRMARYAQMLWAFNRRFSRYRFLRTRRNGMMELSRAERALHNQVKEDLKRAWAVTRHQDRRKSYPIIGLMNIVDLMPDAGRTQPEYDERTRNVV